IRCCLLFALFGLWVGLVFVFWRRKLARLVWLATSVILSVALLLPQRGFSTANLRQNYLQALQSYEGTRYIWGGETTLGIDCSRLVRKGLIDANVRQGILTMNPALLRLAFDLWWHDASAKELSNGYGNRARPVQAGSSINQLNYEIISPGDIAVTSDG